MKLPSLLSRVRNVSTSALDRYKPSFGEQPVRKRFERRAFAHLRLTGRALQARNRRIQIRDGYSCQLCGRVCDKHEGEVDHKIPLSQGGADDDGNLQWLCKEPCHRIKSQRESRGQ
jgi:5-methylcytosine-specific restriction protein A